jgi:pantoate--beta-alanine ligase
VQATSIYKTLTGIKQKIKPGPLAYLKKDAEEYLISKNLKPDYIEIAVANDLKPVNEWDGKTSLVVLAAAFIEEVRLIDNILVND